MPKESFWDSSTAIEGDGSEPVLTVGWGGETPAVTLNDVEFDRSGINRLIAALVKARNNTWGADQNGADRTVTVTLKVDTSEFEAAVKSARKQLDMLKP